MRKAIVPAAVLVAAAIALRRFGPSIRAWCEAKCQQMMAGRRRERAADAIGASSPARTWRAPGFEQEVISMMDGGWSWIGGGLMMILFWGGVIALIVFLARGGARSSEGGDRPRVRDARDVLAERFARGEISQDEFEQRKRVLERR